MQTARTAALVNTALVMPTAEFTRRTRTGSFPRARWSSEITRRGRQATREFVDATKLATGADGRLDRDQHVHARLRVPARADAAVGQPRSCARSSSTASPSSPTSKSFRWGRRAAVDLARGAPHRDAGVDVIPIAAPVARPRRADRARASSSSPPTRTRATRSATARWSTRAQAREREQGRRARKLTEAVARYYFKLLALQGRVRSRAAVHATATSASSRGAVRGRLQAHVPPRAAALRQADPLTGEPQQDAVRPVDDGGVQGARED